MSLAQGAAEVTYCLYDTKPFTVVVVVVVVTAGGLGAGGVTAEPSSMQQE
jgi:hypothetical protein